jgi:AraC-like DNA-binding protein
MAILSDCDGVSGMVLPQLLVDDESDIGYVHRTLHAQKSIFSSQSSRISLIDPLSEILSLLKPNGYGFRGLDAGGEWALSYEASHGMKCFAVTTGTCWLSFEEMAEPLRLTYGDFVLLPGGKACRLSSAPDVQPIDAMQFFLTVPGDENVVLNGGGGCAGVGGGFGFEGPHAGFLLSVLPQVVHINAEAHKATLRQSIERLMREMREPQPGSSLLATHLAQALLIEALRFHLMDHASHGRGWLFALADRQMHAVISAMHLNPERKWTLAALARVAGMSRSSFAARFKDTVGEPAMDYLTRWRMLIAADRLANADVSIAAVAPTVGYFSESAFGATFKRVIGHSPKQYAKGVGVE